MVDIIRLSPAEMIWGATAGAIRQVQDVKDKCQEAYGADAGEDWQLNIEGVLAELAFCKMMNIYPTGLFRRGATDAGGFQVRGTRWPNGRLRLHKRDKDHEPFILMTGINGVYTYRGWMLAGDGKRSEWWEAPQKNNRFAYFVPQEFLHPERPSLVVPQICG